MSDWLVAGDLSDPTNKHAIKALRKINALKTTHMYSNSINLVEKSDLVCVTEPEKTHHMRTHKHA